MNSLISKIKSFWFQKKYTHKTNSGNWATGRFIAPFLIVTFFLVLLPIILLLLYAFISPNSNFNIFSFTLANLFYFFQNNEFIVVFGWTIFFAFIATIICFVMGFPFAYFLAMRVNKKKALILLVTMPIWLNTLVKVLSIRVIITLINPNLMGTTFVLILAMVFLFLPFMILSIYNVLSAVDKKILEASTDLGASNWQTLRKIILPLAVPGIINGIILTFLPALSTLVIAQYLGDGKAVTIAKIIENYFINGSDLPMGAAISIILAAFTLIVTYGSRKIQRQYSYDINKKDKRKAQ